MRGNTRSEFIVLDFGTKRPRVRIPPLRFPEALIFLRFRVFCFWRKDGFFPVCNLPGCSAAARHPAADSKMPFPKISGNDRFFPRGNLPVKKCQRFSVAALKFSGRPQSPLNRVSGRQGTAGPGCGSRTPGWRRNIAGWTRAGRFGRIVGGEVFARTALNEKL